MMPARAQREAQDDIWVTTIRLSAVVRKRTGPSSSLRAAAIVRWTRTLRTFNVIYLTLSAGAPEFVVQDRCAIDKRLQRIRSLSGLGWGALWSA